ncbi:hypothetical protein [Granulicoccus phenolivorans]|uniref:hypothetical protein n=1 Tax=Granulicoccus phenolivorans TaxID=266854 RepID=UPI000427828D|nr:hypothetical protein [Granulicoccus phenolivorans]
MTVARAIEPDFSGVLDLLVPGLRRRGDRFVILIDGGSGAGKTTLAGALHAALPGTQLVGLDECYPGWDGLAAAAEMVARDLLAPLTPGFRRWDWVAGRPADWVSLDPDRPLIIEGCGALTPASAPAALLRIWLDREAGARRTAALARDGATFEAHWEQWAAQERAHWAAHRPWELADLVVEVTGEPGTERIG